MDAKSLVVTAIMGSLSKKNENRRKKGQLTITFSRRIQDHKEHSNHMYKTKFL